jgi:hypothetical protein
MIAMKRSKCTESQIVFALKQDDIGTAVAVASLHGTISGGCDTVLPLSVPPDRQVQLTVAVSPYGPVIGSSDVRCVDASPTAHVLLV